MSQVILETQCRCRRIVGWDIKKRGFKIIVPRMRPWNVLADLSLEDALKIEKPMTRTFRFEGMYDLHGEKPLPLFREVDE